MRPEYLGDTTIASESGQTAIDLKLEVKLVFTHYHFHGRGCIAQSDALEVNTLPLSLV